MDDVKFWAVITAFVGAILGVPVFLAVVVTFLTAPRTCYEFWAGSGMDSRWGFWSGCLIEVSEGEWIPAANYRDIMPRNGEKDEH